MLGPAPGTAAALLRQRPLPSAGSLFTLTVERELEGGKRQRSALRILASPSAVGPCPKPYVPELRLCTRAELGPLSGTPVVLLRGRGGNLVPGGEAGGIRTPQWEPMAGSYRVATTPQVATTSQHGERHPRALMGQGSADPGVWVPSPSLSRGVSRPTRRARATGHPPPDTGCLPWIMEQLLEGNSLTFLLLCVTLPGSPWDWDAALGVPLP